VGTIFRPNKEHTKDAGKSMMMPRKPTIPNAEKYVCVCVCVFVCVCVCEIVCESVI